MATNPTDSVREDAASPELIIRSLTSADCRAVAAIIGHFAAREILLWRTPEDIEKHLDSFLLGELDGEVMGCVALQDYGNGLLELRSLAVAEAYWGKGYGSNLIMGALDLARERGADRVFALTKRPGLFVRNGFVVTDRNDFPQKVWNDCSLCPKRDHCIEIAVVYCLDSGRGTST